MQSHGIKRLTVKCAILHFVLSITLSGFDFALYVKHFRDHGASPTPVSPLLSAVHLISSAILYPLTLLARWVGLAIESNWTVLLFLVINSILFGVVVFCFAHLFHRFRGKGAIHA